MKNHYEVLEIGRLANQDDIKKAYRKLAKKYHPDANPGNEKAAAHFKKIAEAYNILSDSRKKAEYDKKFSGGGGKPPLRKTKPKPKNTETHNKIDLPDIIERTNKEFGKIFGLDPRTKEHNLNQKQEDVINPMKTKDAFEAFFGKKKF